MAPGRSSASAETNFRRKDGKVSKRTRKVLTLTEKMVILDKLRNGMSFAACSRAHGINESTLRYMKKSEKDIREAVALGAPVSAKVCQHVRNIAMIKMEKSLSVWLEDLNRQHVPLDTIRIREKAKKMYEYFSKECGEKQPFVASKGWFENLKKRFALRNLRITGQTRLEDQSSSEQRVNCVQHTESLRKESCTPVKSCELTHKQLDIEPPLGNLELKEEITEEIDIKVEGEDFCTPLNEEISSSPTKDPLDMISSTCYPSNSPTKDPLEEISSTCFPSSSPTKDPLEVISSTCFPSSSTAKDPLEVISSTCFPSSSATQDPLEVISSTCFPSTDQLKVDCNDSNTMPVRKTMEMDVDHQLDSHLQASEGAEDPPQYTRTAKMVGQLLATLSPSAQLKMTVEVMQFIVERLPHYKET